MGSTEQYPLDDVDLYKTGNISVLSVADYDFDTVLDDHYTLPNEVQVGLFFLYGINIFISVAGNIVVIFVFTYGHKSRTELAPFLINLAVSDLIMAIACMPFTSTQVLLGKWIYPHFLCPAVSFMQHTAVSSSIYTQTFISIDRLRSICRPFRTRGAKSPRDLCKILGFIWLWSLAQASVQFYVSKVQPLHTYDVTNGSMTYLCLETWPSWPYDQSIDWSSIYSRFYTICVFSVDYVIPLLCIGCAYTYVGRKLWERTTPGEASDSRDKVQLQSKRKVVKMLALMVLSFGILWLPLQTFFLLHDFSTFLTDLRPKYYHTLFVTCHFVAMLSVIVNIIIYVLVNNNFKSDFRYLMRKYCWKRLPHSEAHRQAVALRRTPAIHYHRRPVQLAKGYYSNENSQSSPVHPYKRPISVPYDLQYVRCGKTFLQQPNGSVKLLTVGQNGTTTSVRCNGTTPLSTSPMRSYSQRSLPNIRPASKRGNFSDYSSNYSDV
ncbi:substance-P receptor-like [Paramacrobiotus metropolitanus]|uniref:substance-P receptor-like n=1 Tax=Paramacrobiotus metropolitanus TaxID=2943436 RepID=UPI0024458F9D|nr:substance-P receptor-like [Paramacrobiotus metropolitanus]XP_055330175.1 substance-P receptor-like [Paramacrobiotus metropolitanus]XP_055330176.1 substance-P receptor-like [Paramacrobiotus metropolitanus]